MACARWANRSALPSLPSCAVIRPMTSERANTTGWKTPIPSAASIAFFSARRARSSCPVFSIASQCSSHASITAQERTTGAAPSRTGRMILRAASCRPSASCARARIRWTSPESGMVAWAQSSSRPADWLQPSSRAARCPSIAVNATCSAENRFSPASEIARMMRRAPAVQSPVSNSAAPRSVSTSTLRPWLTGGSPASTSSPARAAWRRHSCGSARSSAP